MYAMNNLKGYKPEQYVDQFFICDSHIYSNYEDTFYGEYLKEGEKGPDVWWEVRLNCDIDDFHTETPIWIRCIYDFEKEISEYTDFPVSDFLIAKLNDTDYTDVPATDEFLDFIFQSFADWFYCKNS